MVDLIWNKEALGTSRQEHFLGSPEAGCPEEAIWSCSDCPRPINLCHLLGVRTSPSKITLCYLLDIFVAARNVGNSSPQLQLQWPHPFQNPHTDSALLIYWLTVALCYSTLLSLGTGIRLENGAIIFFFYLLSGMLPVHPVTGPGLPQLCTVASKISNVIFQFSVLTNVPLDPLSKKSNKFLSSFMTNTDNISSLRPRYFAW